MEGSWVPRSRQACRYFANGYCRGGNTCRFSHVLQIPLYDMPNALLFQSQHPAGRLEAEIGACNVDLPSESVALGGDWNRGVNRGACQACTLMVSNPTATVTTAMAAPRATATATTSAMTSTTTMPSNNCAPMAMPSAISPPNATASATTMTVPGVRQRLTACRNSRNEERRLEAEAGRLRSMDKTCGVCLEVIIEKQPGEQRFGILPNCQHCFCLTCLRKWRQARQFQTNIIRSCPQCRVPSDFVCPSVFWVETPEQKDKLINDYKTALGLKDCKYFRSGRGKCPFGNKCFYRHAFPDGTKADVGPPHPRSRARPRHRRDVDILEQE